LEQFVEPDRIEPARFSGRSLYLFPDGLPAQRPYLVLAEALKQRTKWAVGRITMSGHRHVVVVRPAGRTLSMHVLHDPRKLRAASPREAELSSNPTNQEELELACTLIDSATTALDWSHYHDDTADKMSALIEAKVEGQELVAPTEEPVQVLKLLDALKQSVTAASGKGKTAGAQNHKRLRFGRRRSA
jgi:DNA end-binding protein Ku